MAYQMTRKQYVLSVLYGQVMITVLVILNVFYPQYLGYTFIIFAIGMAVSMAIMMKSQLKGVFGKESREIKSGRRLFVGEAKEVTELQRMDIKLISEMRPMFKSTMYSFLTLIVLLIWYPLYFGHVKAIITNSDISVRIAAFLAGYEIPYVVITVINQLTRSTVKEMINVVMNYEVYDRGIVGPGLAVKFPLDPNYYLIVSPKRRFVDLVMTRGKFRMRYRFYTKNLSRLVEIIKRYGKLTKVEQES